MSFEQDGQSPVPAWEPHKASQVWPQGKTLPHGFEHVGTESSHVWREAFVKSTNGVLPQGQCVTTSGERGQCPGSGSSG